MRTGTGFARVATQHGGGRREKYNPVMDEIIRAIDAGIKRLEGAKALLIGAEPSGKRGSSARHDDLSNCA